MKQSIRIFFSTTMNDFTTTNGKDFFSYKTTHPNWEKWYFFLTKKGKILPTGCPKSCRFPALCEDDFFDDVNFCPYKKKRKIYFKEPPMRRAKKKIAFFTSIGPKTAQAFTDFWTSSDARKLFGVKYMDQSDTQKSK